MFATIRFRIFRLLFRNVKVTIYKTVIVPVLFGCETWSATLMMFENSILRMIFGPKRDEVTGEWRKLPN
jgi:hypothetical protein